MYIDSIRAYVPQDAQEAADRAMILDYIARFPDILTRNNPIAHISSSGFVVNADASKVLMAHHNIFRVWAWTGGHADGETDLLSVALREAREETGAVHILPLSAEIASVDKYVCAHQHLNVSYLLTADEGDPLRPRAGENTQVAWLDAERMLEITNEWQMDYVYTKLLDRARSLLRGAR